MDTINMLTEREEELIAELRIVRKKLYASPPRCKDFDDNLKEFNRLHEALTLERHRKHRARIVVEFLNNKPRMNGKVFQILGGIFGTGVVTVAGIGALFGDIGPVAYPLFALGTMSLLCFSIYYFDYICQTRK